MTGTRPRPRFAIRGNLRHLQPPARSCVQLHRRRRTEQPHRLRVGTRNDAAAAAHRIGLPSTRHDPPTGAESDCPTRKPATPAGRRQFSIGRAAAGQLTNRVPTHRSLKRESRGSVPTRSVESGQIADLRYAFAAATQVKSEHLAARQVMRR